MAIEILADLNEVQPSSEEWLKLRKLGIGGSDAGAICGLSRFRTPYQVWADKVNPTIPPEDEKEYQTWGKLLEAPIRDEFSRRTGVEVHPLPKMIRNTDHPFMLANVDGVTGPSNKLTGAYEGKTTRFADQWPKDENGVVQVPLGYVVQGMHYLAVLDQLEVIHFACLIGGQELRIATVERNQALIDDLIEIEEAFWRKVLEGEPPEVSGSDVPVLKKMWTPEAGKTVELLGTYATSLRVRAQKKANIKLLEADIDQIDAEIMDFMGDAEEAYVDGKVAVTWKESSRASADWDEIARLTHRTVADAKAAMSKTTTSRRFLPKDID